MINLVESNGQEFVNSSNLWYEKHYNFIGYSFTQVYRFQGDTTLENKFYLKLEKASDETLMNWEWTGELFREDSLNQVYKLIENQEELIYDFDQGINYTEFYWNCGMELESVDTIALWNGMLANQYTYENGNGTISTIIEGIGTIGSVFNPDYDCVIDNLIYLSCFYRDGELVHRTNYGIDECYGTTSTNRIEITKFKMHPNLLKRGEQIKVSGNGKCEIQIIDIQGRSLIKKTIIEEGFIKMEIPGLYFYQILKEGKIRKTGKLIVK
jgi:hypothetical protein